MPSYPPADIKNGTSGVAVAHIEVDETGEKSKVTVVEAPSATISAEVLRAVSLWQFAKTRTGGRPTILVGNLTFYFSPAEEMVVFSIPLRRDMWGGGPKRYPRRQHHQKVRRSELLLFRTKYRCFGGNMNSRALRIVRTLALAGIFVTFLLAKPLWAQYGCNACQITSGPSGDSAACVSVDSNGFVQCVPIGARCFGYGTCIPTGCC